MTDPFSAGVAASLSPWNDGQGDWQALIAAYASMFSDVANIVTERGSPDGPLIGVTTAPIANTGAITSIPIGSALMTVAANQPVMIVAAGGTIWEDFIASGAVAKGAVSVAVNSQTPRNSYPAGSFVQLGYLSGWASVLDPDRADTRFLPYLAQYVGVSVPPNTSDADARAIIKAESGFQRGTAASILSAAKRNLNGTQSCFLLERTPDAYQITLVMRPEEVATSPSAIVDAVTAVKPAGIIANFVYTDGWILNQMEAAYGTITALEAAFTTVNGIEGDQVGH